VTVPLGGLGRKEIGQIVAGRGFTGPAFRSHVAVVAQGSAWLAYGACLIVAERGSSAGATPCRGARARRVRP
jgi:hypothetical protein